MINLQQFYNNSEQTDKIINPNEFPICNKCNLVFDNSKTNILNSKLPENILFNIIRTQYLELQKNTAIFYDIIGIIASEMNKIINKKGNDITLVNITDEINKVVLHKNNTSNTNDEHQKLYLEIIDTITKKINSASIVDIFEFFKHTYLIISNALCLFWQSDDKSCVFSYFRFHIN